MQNPEALAGSFRFNNGSTLDFKAYDSENKAKHGKRDILFINEANDIPYPIAEQLMMRTRKKIYIDFNPTAEFWAHTELVKKEKYRTDYFISNYQNNPYLENEQLQDIQRLLENYLMEGTDYWQNRWDVYGLGLTGVVEGTIFGHNTFKIPSFDRVTGLKRNAYAIDFGFTNDPTAVLQLGIKFGNVYGKQLLYQTGQYGDILIDTLKDLDLNKRYPLIVDKDEFSTIVSLRKAGYKVLPCKKWPGSVKQGIDFMQGKNIYIEESSVDWWYERDHYKFKKDRLTGKYTNDPEDKNNHCWDAARYYTMAVFDQTPESKRQRSKSRVENVPMPHL